MKQRITHIIMLSTLSMLVLLGVSSSFHTEIRAGSVLNDGFTDLSVEEVWNLVNDTTNGIQYLIDVRTDSEWVAEHIDAPYPERARHHCKCEWGNEAILQAFMDMYEGEEIILYCLSGGRSVGAANTLINNGFVGTIYNMVGGISHWKTNGYPTTKNFAPEPPQITGPTTGIPDQCYQFTVTTTDGNDDALSYYVNWGDGETEIYQGPYESAEPVLLSYQWDSAGCYQVEVRARDPYFAQSNWTSFTMHIASTTLEIINLQQGIGSVSYTLQNTGDFPAENITSTISITGGWLSGVTMNHTCTACDCSLAPGEQKTVSSFKAGFLFGIGSIDLFISAAADNAEQIILSKNGYVIGPFIFL